MARDSREISCLGSFVCSPANNLSSKIQEHASCTGSVPINLQSFVYVDFDRSAKTAALKAAIIYLFSLL